MSSCTTAVTTTEVRYITSTPAKIERPVKPTFEQLDATQSISSKDNFRKIQFNLLVLKGYTNSLLNTIKYYEDEIDRLEQLNTNITK